MNVTDVPFNRLVSLLSPKIDFVIHGGACLAEEAEVYFDNELQPVFWIEANPLLIDSLRDRLSDFNGQVCYEAALWSETGIALELNIASNLGSSSLLKPLEHLAVYPQVLFKQSIEVQSMTLDHLCLKLDGSGLLVLDTQGAELEVLKGSTETLRKVKFIYVEYSTKELYESGSTLKSLETFLAGKFSLIFSTQSQWLGYGNALFCEKLPLYQILRIRFSLEFIRLTLEIGYSWRRLIEKIQIIAKDLISK